jgi:hypothetical protein
MFLVLAVSGFRLSALALLATGQKHIGPWKLE